MQSRHGLCLTMLSTEKYDFSTLLKAKNEK